MELMLQYLPGFLLVLCRISAFFLVAPIFSARNVPSPFKIGIGFFVALITFTSVGFDTVSFDAAYAVTLIREMLIGVLLGFIAYMYFTAMQIAGTFIDIQIGFSMANIFDPTTGTSVAILGNFKYVLAVLLFLSFNGHHYLISAIVESYRWVPLSNESFTRIYDGQVTEFLLKSLSSAFSLAFQLAAPLVVALFLVDAGLGILAKTAPQFNIFVIGIPLKIIVGLLLLMMLIPGFVSLFSGVFQTLFESVQAMINILAGSPQTGAP